MCVPRTRYIFWGDTQKDEQLQKSCDRSLAEDRLLRDGRVLFGFRKRTRDVVRKTSVTYNAICRCEFSLLLGLLFNTGEGGPGTSFDQNLSKALIFITVITVNITKFVVAVVFSFLPFIWTNWNHWYIKKQKNVPVRPSKLTEYTTDSKVPVLIVSTFESCKSSLWLGRILYLKLSTFRTF